MHWQGAGLRTLTFPFVSAGAYRFPLGGAVRICRLRDKEMLGMLRIAENGHPFLFGH
jgi:O-acetyl-ADP-ribose deacetylase (regulator of RNase III)